MTPLDMLAHCPDSSLFPGGKLVGGIEWSEHPELRSLSIGASEAAAAMGLDDYVGPLGLWRRKRGLDPPEDLSAEPSIRHGHLGEPYLMDRAPGLGAPAAAERQIFLYRPEYPFLTATLDGASADGIPIEAKTTIPESRAGVSIAAAVNGGAVSHECLPERWLLQVHQQMLLAGAPEAWVVALVWGRCEAAVRVPRDDELLGRMLVALERFWGHVASGIPPEPGHVDLDVFRMVKPGPGTIVQLPASAAREADALARAEFEVASCEVEIDSRVRIWKERKRSAERRKAEAQARLYAFLGEAEVGVLPDGRRVEGKLRSRRSYEVSAKEYRQLSVRGGKIK